VLLSNFAFISFFSSILYIFVAQKQAIVYDNWTTAFIIGYFVLGSIVMSIASGILSSRSDPKMVMSLGVLLPVIFIVSTIALALVINQMLTGLYLPTMDTYLSFNAQEVVELSIIGAFVIQSVYLVMHPSKSAE
jgi:MFS family permease